MGGRRRARGRRIAYQIRFYLIFIVIGRSKCTHRSGGVERRNEQKGMKGGGQRKGERERGGEKGRKGKR